MAMPINIAVPRPVLQTLPPVGKLFDKDPTPSFIEQVCVTDVLNPNPDVVGDPDYSGRISMKANAKKNDVPAVMKLDGANSTSSLFKKR